MELPTGLEPVTRRLQGGSSTIELWKHYGGASGARTHNNGVKGRCVTITPLRYILHGRC